MDSVQYQHQFNLVTQERYYSNRDFVMKPMDSSSFCSEKSIGHHHTNTINNCRNQTLPASTMKASSPIACPSRSVKHGRSSETCLCHSNEEEEMYYQEMLYRQSTWNMYQRILKARESSGYYNKHTHMLFEQDVTNNDNEEEEKSAHDFDSPEEIFELEM